ncbi:MAG: hypothetical protein GY793_09225 [Proteobacteria bacterium]|nr:hypothetical protein [Pseudomonadota bacterium]
MRRITFVVILFVIFVSSNTFAEEYSYCQVEETKVKPVSFNGMFNSRRGARNSASMLAIRMQDIYGKDVILSTGEGTTEVEGYYLAYNESEFWLTQIGEVAALYLFDLICMSGKTYDEETDKNILDHIRSFAIRVDGDAQKHEEDIRGFIEAGFKLVFGAHSQGNIYYNMLYNLFLSSVDPSMYRVLSLASPVEIKDSNAKRVIDQYDFIRMLTGGPFNVTNNYYEKDVEQKDKSKITTAVYVDSSFWGRGHAFNYYMRGDQTGKLINNTLKSFLDELYPTESIFTIQISSTSGNYDGFDVLIQEKHHNDTRKTFHSQSTGTDSDWNEIGSPVSPTGFGALPLRGKLYKEEGRAYYSVDCRSLDQVTDIFVGIWNKSETGIHIFTDYSGVFNAYEPDYVQPQSTSLEEYNGVGYYLKLRKDDDGYVTVEKTLVNHPFIIMKMFAKSKDVVFKVIETYSSPFPDYGSYCVGGTSDSIFLCFAGVGFGAITDLGANDYKYVLKYKDGILQSGGGAWVAGIVENNTDKEQEVDLRVISTDGTAEHTVFVKPHSSLYSIDVLTYQGVVGKVCKNRVFN